MSASLYQSGSPCIRPRARSQEVLEVLLPSDPAPYPEDVTGHDLRVQLDVVARPLPQEPGVRQQVVRLERLARLDAERLEVELDPAAVPVVWVGVDDRQHDVVAVRVALAVAQ